MDFRKIKKRRIAKFSMLKGFLGLTKERGG